MRVLHADVEQAIARRVGIACGRNALLQSKHQAMGYVRWHSCMCARWHGMTAPGVEPGLSWPQRGVLTTRRCGLLACMRSQTVAVVH